MLVSAGTQMGVWVCAQISYMSLCRILYLCGKVHTVYQTPCPLVVCGLKSAFVFVCEHICMQLCPCTVLQQFA